MEREERIDSRIEIHDRNQFEVKLDYTIDTKRRTNRYQVDAYFFVPRSLAITNDTYSATQFLNDIQAYIRFKTPLTPLAALVDTNNPKSPLTHLERMVPQFLNDPTNADLSHRIYTELRMFGCLARATIRNMTGQLGEKLEALHRGNGHRVLLRDFEEISEALVRDGRKIMHRFRKMRLSFLDQAMPPALRQAYLHVDEFLSMVIESYLTLGIEEIDTKKELRPALDATRQSFSVTLTDERAYRQGADYEALLTPGESNENYVYRNSFLKKFVMSVLFLEISKQQERRRAADAAAAAAAGVAMLFAAVAAIYAQQLYGLNTLPFVIALVVSYVVKDRIKDWLKNYFSNKVSRWFPDSSIRITDPATGQTVGRCNESVSFVGRDKVPADVIARREEGGPILLDAESKPEVIIRYTKEVRIRREALSASHGRLSDINDIIRFNISNFLVRSDDPYKDLRFYNPESDSIEDLRCLKAYHVNSVFVFRALGSSLPPKIVRTRVVLTKKGLLRLEHI